MPIEAKPSTIFNPNQSPNSAHVQLGNIEGAYWQKICWWIADHNPEKTYSCFCQIDGGPITGSPGACPGKPQSESASVPSSTIPPENTPVPAVLAITASENPPSPATQTVVAWEIQATSTMAVIQAAWTNEAIRATSVSSEATATAYYTTPEPTPTATGLPHGDPTVVSVSPARSQEVIYQGFSPSLELPDIDWKDIQEFLLLWCCMFPGAIGTGIFATIYTIASIAKRAE